VVKERKIQPSLARTNGKDSEVVHSLSFGNGGVAVGRGRKTTGDHQSGRRDTHEYFWHNGKW
jgi:hypothetical protein